MKLTQARGGVLTVVVGLMAAGSIGAMAVWSVASASSSSSTAAPVAAVPPLEIGAMLTQAGLTPETLAAAGLTVGECNVVFDAATVYGLGANRLAQLREAIRALNQANERAVRPAPRAAGAPPVEPPDLAHLREIVDDLRDQAFSAYTGTLVPSQVQKLSNIRANSDWSALPLPYRTVTRERSEWLTLRAALDAKESARRRGRELDAVNAQRLAEADANQTVAAAAEDLAQRAAGIREIWDARFR